MGILRLLLAVSVVLAHTSAIFGFNLAGGQIAVETFYVISGFYMCLVLNEKYIGKNNSYKLFLSNRLLRLFPIYLFVLLLAVVRLLMIYFLKGTSVSTLNQYMSYWGYMGLTTKCYLIFTNICLIGQDTVMFSGLSTHTGALFFTKDFYSTSPQLYTFLFIPQAWTIGIEILFYIIAPLIVRQNFIRVFLLFAISVCIKGYLHYIGLKNDPWSYRFFPSELLYFLAGYFAYRLYKKIQHMRFPRWQQVLPLLLFGLLVIFYNKINLPFKYYIYFSVFVLVLPLLFVSTKNYKWDAAIGELSYPVYISHMFVLAVLSVYITRFNLNSGITISVASILFSVLLNKFIAFPVEKFRQRRVTIARQKALVTSA